MTTKNIDSIGREGTSAPTPWRLLAAVLVLVACASRQPANNGASNGSGTTSATTSATTAPVDLDGSLLNDPEIQALLPRPCDPPTQQGGQLRCSDGCQLVGGECRRVQGVIRPPEHHDDGGVNVIRPPETR